jgi:hypothetical protein
MKCPDRQAVVFPVPLSTVTPRLPDAQPIRKPAITRWMMAGLAVAVLGTVAPGCAAMRAAIAQKQVVDARTAEHVYAMPCPAVWPAVRSWLFEKGYAVKPTGESALIVETDWRTDNTDNSGVQTWSRYLAQAMVPADNQCRLMMMRGKQNSSAQTTDRDLDAEWIILQRVDPTRAQAIADEANRAGNQAR